jgi:hypothetical protein
MPTAHWDQSSDDPDESKFSDLYDTDGESSETVPCPECQAEIYEDTERCPVCGSYIIHDTSVWGGKPTWWIILALLGIIAVIVTLALGP